MLYNAKAGDVLSGWEHKVGLYREDILLTRWNCENVFKIEGTDLNRRWEVAMKKYLANIKQTQIVWCTGYV